MLAAVDSIKIPFVGRSEWENRGIGLSNRGSYRQYSVSMVNAQGMTKSWGLEERCLSYAPLQINTYLAH